MAEDFFPIIELDQFVDNVAFTVTDRGMVLMALAGPTLPSTTLVLTATEIAGRQALDVNVNGNVAHDAVDIGNPIKVGAIATDYEPDTAGEQGAGEVAPADRVNIATNLRGEQIQGVNSKFTLLPTLNVVYDGSPSSVTGPNVECWNYREGRFHLDIVSAGTPGTIQIQVQTSNDGTNFTNLTEGPLGAWIYSDASVAIEKKESYPFQLNGDRFVRVVITASSVSIGNTYTVANAYISMRN